MILLSWNCWGLGNLCAGTVLSHLVREKAPTILFLMETKQTVEEMKQIQSDLRYSAMLAVPCVRRAGGLAMLWREEKVDLHVQTYSMNHIEAHVPNGQNPWRITGFYGHLEHHRKHESWQLLRHLHS